jgi:hypothetical protein
VSRKSTLAAKGISVAAVPAALTQTFVPDPGELRTPAGTARGPERGIFPALERAEKSAPAPKIGGLLRARPRVKKPRTWSRFIYAGVLTAGVLHMRRGAFIRKTDADGAIVEDFRDERMGLLVNLGDRVVLSSSSANDNAIAEVTRIEPGWCERLHVSIRAGSIADGAVHVLNAKGLGK